MAITDLEILVKKVRKVMEQDDWDIVCPIYLGKAERAVELSMIQFAKAMADLRSARVQKVKRIAKSLVELHKEATNSMLRSVEAELKSFPDEEKQDSFTPGGYIKVSKSEMKELSKPNTNPKAFLDDLLKHRKEKPSKETEDDKPDPPTQT